jgi:uncharacterized membrane protein YdjX (TVP38/TMEM64 family)
VILAVAFAATFFLVPAFNYTVRTAGSVLGSGEPSSVRIFLVTHGHRSPIAAIALVAWQAIAFPLPDVPVLRAVGLMWGPVLGSIINWVGLVLGAAAIFALGRALIGVPVANSFPLKSERLGIAPWVVFGLRIIPFVPSDLVSVGAGCTRTRWRDFLIPVAAGALPAAVVYAVFGAEIPNAATSALMWAGTAVGGALLAGIAWRYRANIPFGTLSVERKRTLVAGVAMVVVGVLVYQFVPAFKAGVDAAVTKIASGDISAVRDYLLTFGPWAPVISALLMILQSIVAPLPAFVVTFSNGLLFGWMWGALLSWSSAMAGAALCFFLARALGRPAVEKLVGGSTALEVSDRFFDRFGERAVLIARLLPFVSFDIISYGAGLTSMKFWPFFIATGLGQLPATLVYSYLGQNMGGSVRILFFTFVITTAIFVAIAAARPAFQRWLNAQAAEKEAEAETGVAAPAKPAEPAMADADVSN